MQLVAFNAHSKAGQDHSAHGHFVDECVQPIHKQDFRIRSLALDPDLAGLHEPRVGDNAGKRDSRLFEGLCHASSDAPDADIDAVS